MSNEIVTQCGPLGYANPVAPLGHSGLAVPGIATGVFVELPIVKDHAKATTRLMNYLESRRNNTTPQDKPDDWINNIRNGVYENITWPAIEGGTKNHEAIADLFASMRRAILGLKKGEYWECAEILYRHIPAEYEYIAGCRGFWTLLAVYVVPEWPYLNFDVLKSDSVRDRRYALKGSTATRDTLAQYWWKYHILTRALGEKPTKDSWNNTTSDVWQERTNVFKNQDVVRAIAKGLAPKSTPGEAAAKRLGKYLYVSDAGSLAMEAALAKETVSPGNLSPTAARLKINVEREDIADGLRKVQSVARLDAYEEALKKYLISGNLADPATREGAALLALAALGGYRLNRQEWRDKEVDAGTSAKVLETWRGEGAEYVFEVIGEVRSASPDSKGRFEFLGLGSYTSHTSGPSNNMLISYSLSVPTSGEVCVGHGYFKVGDLYTRTEIMAAGLDSFDAQFKHWAEGSGTLGGYPLLVGNQNPEMYPGESFNLAGKTVTVHSEKGARESNSGKRYLTEPVLLFWCHSNERGSNSSVEGRT